MFSSELCTKHAHTQRSALHRSRFGCIFAHLYHRTFDNYIRAYPSPLFSRWSLIRGDAALPPIESQKWSLIRGIQKGEDTGIYRLYPDDSTWHNSSHVALCDIEIPAEHCLIWFWLAVLNESMKITFYLEKTIFLSGSQKWCIKFMWCAYAHPFFS